MHQRATVYGEDYGTAHFPSQMNDPFSAQRPYMLLYKGFGSHIELLGGESVMNEPRLQMEGKRLIPAVLKFTFRQ